MVMVPTIPSRWVKGEASFDLAALPEPMPRPHHLERQHRSSTRRRNGAIEPLHEHYVHLSLDQFGRPLIRSSPSLTSAEAEYILGVDACQRFLECLPTHPSSQNVHPKYDLTGLQSMPPGAATFVSPEINAGQVAYPFHRHAKRRRSSTVTGCGIPDNHHRRRRDSRSVIPTYRKTVSIRVGETEAMEKWYREAFHAVQQVSCRLVAKLWIKRIHLKKQSTHPYNGNFPRDKPRDPNRTRPYYWPENVRHKEPDHITRNERVAVLIEIISRTPLMEINSTDREKHFINAEQLLESLDERRIDIPDEKWEILKDIVKARSFQEKFGRQEIDAQAEITLLDCCVENHKVQADGEIDDDLSDGEGGHPDLHLEGGSSAEQTTDEETSMTPNSANLPSPLDKVQKGSGQSTRIKSHKACANFQESFTSDATKAEDSVDASEAYPRSRGLNHRRHKNSQHESPRLEMTHERFEDDMFGATNASEQEPNSMATLDGLSNQRHHEETMQPWQISSLPPNIFVPAYDNSSSFRVSGIAMSMEDQLVFEEARYRHNTASTRQHGMISSLRFAGPPYSTGFDTSNQNGLPMRPASGPRQDLMSHELAMSSNANPYYHLS